MMKKKYLLLLSGILVFELSACSGQSIDVSTEENLLYSFEEQIATAPINQPVVIKGETPFGSDLSYVVFESYTSGLGTICRQAMVENTNKFFVVCNQNKDFQKKAEWVLIPALD